MSNDHYDALEARDPQAAKRRCWPRCRPSCALRSASASAWPQLLAGVDAGEHPTRTALARCR